MADETGYKRCVCYIQYEDGTSQLSRHSLEGNLMFSLEEMENWIKERSEKAVKEVRCYSPHEARRG